MANRGALSALIPGAAMLMRIGIKASYGIDIGTVSFVEIRHDAGPQWDQTVIRLRDPYRSVCCALHSFARYERMDS